MRSWQRHWKFLDKNKIKNEDLLLEVTKIHIAIAKFLWQIKLQKFKRTILGYDSDYDISK